ASQRRARRKPRYLFNTNRENSMTNRGWLSYIWNEHLEPFLVMIPMFPFILAAASLNQRLRKVADRHVPTVKMTLRIFFALALALCLGTAILSGLDYIGWLSFELLHRARWRPIPELLLFWLAAGMYTFHAFVNHGNWQLRGASASGDASSSTNNQV